MNLDRGRRPVDQPSSDDLSQSPQHLVPIGIVLRQLRHQSTDPLDQPSILSPTTQWPVRHVPDDPKQHLAEILVDVRPFPIDMPGKLQFGIESLRGAGQQRLGVRAPE